MGKPLIISISGLRGIIGDTLDPYVAVEYGAAFGTFLKGQKNGRGRAMVCIGRDSRPSGPMIMSALVAGLTGVGVDVVDLGIVTTPSVGIMVRHLGADGGVVITASHNPVAYNGVKLLTDTGVAPAPDLAGEIRKAYFDKAFDWHHSLDCGISTVNDQTDEVHIGRVLTTVAPDAIRKKKFLVALDSVNGAGGRPGIKLLEQLGCTVTGLNIEPTGIFAHEPEPIPENLDQICRAVKETGAHIGMVQDPDADRLALVDEQGRCIGEECTLALAAQYVLQVQGGDTATNLSTSRMIDDIAARNGCQVFRTPVGEANVAAAMIANNCLIGGEGNGGVIDLRVGPIRDSLVAMALVLQLMAETGQPVSALADQINPYTMHKEKFTAEPDQALAILDLAQSAYPEARIDTRDGLRFDFDDAWIHLRSSNTEPVMRMIIEARDQERIDHYAHKIREIQKAVLVS